MLNDCAWQSIFRLQRAKQGCACSGIELVLKAGLSCSSLDAGSVRVGHGHCRLQDVEAIDQFGRMLGFMKTSCLESETVLKLS